MKRSQTPTDYLIVKAETDNDFDTCEFALVHLTPEWKEAMRERLAMMKSFSGDTAFNYMSFDEAPEGFYCSPYDDDVFLTKELLGKEDDWGFVVLEDGEPECFGLPDTALVAHQTILTNCADVYWKAYAKYDSTKYWTNFIDIDILINT